MAVLGVSAGRSGLTLAGGAAAGDAALDAALARALSGLPAEAPVAVLVHGYKFDPARPHADPHRSLFSATALPASWKAASWPVGLGLDAPGAGLAIGFGWPAFARHLPSLAATRQTAFARVYERALVAGEALADLIGRLRRRAPWRRVDVLAHSLGARVALAALPHLERGPDRMLLLGAAEYRSRAADFLLAGPSRPPALYNITTRANDLYDALFEFFAPGARPGDRALGHGLPDAPAPGIDLQIDHPAVTAALNTRGIPLTPCGARACHWSFYTRPGAFALYRAIIGRKPGWDVASLRGDPALALTEPRWSRFLRGGATVPPGNEAAVKPALPRGSVAG
jgi:hypothetical protein